MVNSLLCTQCAVDESTGQMKFNKTLVVMVMCCHGNSLRFTYTDVYDGVSACGYSTHSAVMSSQVRGGGCEMGGSERGNV